MTYNAQRVSDSNSGGGSINNAASNLTVFTNGLLQSIDGSTVNGHGIGPHASPTTANGSNNVLICGVPANFQGNPDSCGDVRVGGSSNVFINAGGLTIPGLPVIDTSPILNSATTPEINTQTSELFVAIALADEEEEDTGLALFPNPSIAGGPPITQSQINDSISNGLHPDLADPVGIEEDTAVVPPVLDVPGDCATDIFSEITDFNFPGTFQLSPNYQLKDLTTHTALSNYGMQTQAGFTTNQLVCNLRLLCINILEPLKAMYPEAFITSGFRHGSGRSQHERGQAIDVQFVGFSYQQYWDAAKIVKQQLPYDQFILEYGNKPWFHLSYIPNGRHKVLTRIRPGKYVPDLVRLA